MWALEVFIENNYDIENKNLAESIQQKNGV